MSHFAGMEELLQDFLMEAGELLSDVDNKLVELWHRTENLFDKLRTAELTLSPDIMDVIMAATGVVRDMFAHLAQAQVPPPAEKHLLDALDAVIAGGHVSLHAAQARPEHAAAVAAPGQNPDWDGLYRTLLGTPEPATLHVPAASALTEAHPAPHPELLP